MLVRKIGILLTFSFILAACSKSPQELLVGHWKCHGEDENFKFSGDVEYVSNGTSNVMIEMTGEESATKLSFELMAQGTWKLKKEELLETITKLTVTRFSVGGREIPPEKFPKQMKDALVGVTTGSQILQLDERVLLTKYAGNQTTCSRL
ncbi:hypothetical protein [Gayadomonas joobiniege]|uniref:hypothetical protein n=1 Tax=Gayadomonas joobiniege TaxID=1234606 RepID=UPI00036F424B|nr:hypothetical protein [Gayadomonas joobiniege]